MVKKSSSSSPRPTSDEAANAELLQIALHVLSAISAAGANETLSESDAAQLNRRWESDLRGAIRRYKSTRIEVNATLVLASFLARNPRDDRALELFARIESENPTSWQARVSELLRAVAISNGVGQTRGSRSAWHKTAATIARRALEQCASVHEFREGDVEILALFRMQPPLASECLFAVAYHEFNAALPADGDARIDKARLRTARRLLAGIETSYPLAHHLIEDSKCMIGTIDHFVGSRSARVRTAR